MAISSPRDANRIPAFMATSNADGLTPMNIKVNASTHRILASDGLTGSNLPFVNAERDDDRIPVMWGVSATDGTTPIPIYGNPSTGELLIRSN